MPEIFLLGSGIRGTLQFSTETLQAIRACRKVFILHDDLKIHAFIRDLCPAVVDAGQFYTDDGPRRSVYEAISEALIEEALVDPPVGFLVHGHPLFLVSATELILEGAALRGLSTSVIPAISSFDTLLCDLSLDFGYALQIFDATTLIRESIELNPYVPTLIFQIATVLNDNVARGDISAQAVEPLTTYLLRFYPENHVCEVVYSGTDLIEAAVRTKAELGQITAFPNLSLWKRPTLFVPAVRRS